MLQPLQLEEVTAAYAAEIAQIRDFLAKSGLPVRTADGLHAIVARLRQDRTFHRDLTSHLWVLMERGSGPAGISHGTVLGILAIAAAGPQLAANADTADAHDLLRFVMAARRSLDTAGVVENADHPETGQPAPSVPAVASEVPPLSLPLRTTPATPQVEPAKGSGRRFRWALAALAVMLLAVAGGWLALRPSTRESAVPAPIVSAPANEQPPATQPPASTGISGASSSPILHRSAPATATLRQPGTTVGAAVNPPEHVTAVHQVPSGGDAGANLVSSSPSVPQTATSGAAPVRVAGKTATVPEAVLSRRLGSPAMPSYAPAENEAVTRRHPRLLRRVPDTATLRENDDTLLAEVTPADAPSLPSSSRAGSSGASRPVGTVRPASLGNMAANVVYTPVPPYPADASAAGVQGEVRVQARIDPSGNVASARVISGPPLLRDAALNAVQHWRYRPWMASGRPTATSTVAVVDFELP